MKPESHDEFMGFELRQIPQHDDDCARYGYEVKLPIDGQWYEIDSYTLRWSRQDALEGLVNALRRVMDQKMEAAMKVIRRLERERDDVRTELEEYRSIAENIGAEKAVSEKENAIRERDEARELLRILAGLVAYGLGQSGEEWSLEAMRQATTAIQNSKSLEAAK